MASLKRPIAYSLATLLSLVGFFILEAQTGEAFSHASEVFDGSALQASSPSELIASPDLPQAFVARESLPLRPSLPDAAGTTTSRALQAVVNLRSPSMLEHRSVLVAAQVLEKYLSFRESLTSP